MDEKYRKFLNRWNIEFNENKLFELFKNRIIISFDTSLGKEFICYDELQEEFLKMSGHLNTESFSYTRTESIMGEFNTYNEKRNYFSETQIWNILKKTTKMKDLILLIQIVFWLKIKDKYKEEFYNKIKLDIEYLNIQINIKKTNNEIILYPKGVEVLDKEIVNKTINYTFGEKYIESHNKYVHALKLYSENGKTRDILDSLRLSLESFLRQLLNQKLNLEKLTRHKHIEKFLISKTVPKEIIEMYLLLINQYISYQNEHVKHNDSNRKEDIEFMIYNTGNFINYLCLLEEK